MGVDLWCTRPLPTDTFSFQFHHVLQVSDGILVYMREVWRLALWFLSFYQLPWFLQSVRFLTLAEKGQREYLLRGNRETEIIRQMLLQALYPLLKNTACFSCNLITLNKYFWCSSCDRLMWPLIFFWRSKEMKLRVWENGFPSSCVAQSPIHPCVKIQGDNWLGKSQGLQDNIQNEDSFWELVLLALPLCKTSILWSLLGPVWGCPHCLPSVLTPPKGTYSILGNGVYY